LKDRCSQLLVDSQIVLVAEIAADIRIVGLVPDAPEPVLDLLAAPMLEAAPDDFRRARDKLANVGGIFVRGPKLRERHHPLGTAIEDSLHERREPWPFFEGIGNGLIENKDAHDLRVHEPEPSVNLLAILAHGESWPAIDFVEAVAQPHLL